MHKNEISHFFIYNLLVPKAFLKQVIFYTFFPTIRTCVQFSMIIMPRNLYFATETLNEIGYQKIRSHWLFPKRFGMILGIKVVKCVKIVRKNPHFAKLEDTPSPGGRQLGLVRLLIFCPYMYCLHPCITHIFSAFQARFLP